MIKNFKYRLYPNQSQALALDQALAVCHELYNLCLEERRYRRIGWVEQSREIKDVRATFPEYAAINYQVLQDVVKRVRRAFDGFYRRLKTGERPGYPRFQSHTRYNSFTFRECAFAVSGNRITLSKLGIFKFKLSRPIGGEPRTCTVRQSAGKWYIVVAVKCQPEPLPASLRFIGIDVGIENFAALSDGSFIPNPRIRVTAQPEIAKAVRRVARRKRGSKRREKARRLLEAAHNRIANRRADFLHKESTKLIRAFGLIAIEKLNVAGLSRSALAKQVHDASWAMFFRFLAYKAEWAGRRLVEVDPRGTSQTCPACGNQQKKSLSERKHRCGCGYEAHRDTAAAQVILARAELSGVNVEEGISCVA